MMKEIIRSDEEIKNTISENFKRDIEMINTCYVKNDNLGKEWFSSFPQEVMQSFSEERVDAKGKIHWTLSDISKICICFNIDCVKRYGETRSYISSHNIERYRRWLDRIERFAVSLIRSKVWDGTLTPGKDVVLYGKDFGDDPRDSIFASAFIRIADEENRINEKFFIIKIPDNVREIVEKREKIKVATEKKSDGETVLAYLKSEFIEDIRNGVSKEKLLNKFTSEGILVSTGTQKNYKYMIDGREIRISKERLSYIASILLDSEEKKSDEEIVLAYLKSKFIEDIRNGVSREELLGKFTPKDLSDSTETQKREYYKYTIEDREIRISREGLDYIASILLDSNVKINKKAT